MLSTDSRKVRNYADIDLLLAKFHTDEWSDLTSESAGEKLACTQDQSDVNILHTRLDM